MARTGPLTALGMAALALLLEGPRHPYEMFQIMTDRREDVIVKLRAGTLYHTVGRLADTGLVRATGTDRDGNRPERTTYEITAAGRAALHGAVAEHLAVPTREYPIFPVALAEMHALPPAAAADRLRQRLTTLRRETEALRHGYTAALDRGVPPNHLLDLDYLIATRLGDIEWVIRVIDRIDRAELDWTPYPGSAGAGTTEHRTSDTAGHHRKAEL